MSPNHKFFPIQKGEIKTEYSITGGITEPLSPKAMKHAKLFYEEIRKNRSDVKKISKNTGFTYEQILLVKNYLFIDVHKLGDDDEIEQRFDASFEIAESWRRLAFDPDNIQHHDLTLLEHELMEMRLVNEGLTQHEAHLIASRKYNYALECFDFYEKMRTVAIEKSDKTIISGGITLLKGNTH